MTTQEAYEEIRAWLAREGATKCSRTRSVIGGSEVCLYADGRGNHCAIGGPLALAGKLTTRAARLQETVSGLLRSSRSAGLYFEGVDVMFLTDAQHAHDQPMAGIRWQETALAKLDSAARDHGLRVAGGS